MNQITIDFETRYNKTLSLKKLTTVEYVLNKDFYVFGMGIKHNDKPSYWVHHDDIADELDTIDWDQTEVIAHNTRFEAAILAWHYQVNPARWSDTMSMSKALCHYQSASLKAVAERTFPDDPTMRKGDELVLAEGMDFLDKATEKAIAGYCNQDVELCKAIYDKQIQDYPESELRLIDLTIRMFANPQLHLDNSKLETTLSEEREKKDNVLKELGLTSTQLASNQQFAEILENCQIKIPMKTSPTTGKKTFAFSKTDLGFQKLFDHPVAGPLAKGRLIIKSTQNETRAERLLNISKLTSGALPVPLNYYGAHTGRFSGSDKVNIQNLPRGGSLRKALIAPDDGYLVSCDASQIEARMLAWLTGQADLVEMFRNKVDVYRAFAAQIWRITPDEVDTSQRFVAKTAILGLGYGMGAKKFGMLLKQQGIDMPEWEIKGIVDMYRRTFSKIPDFWQWCQTRLMYMRTLEWSGDTWRNIVTLKPYKIELPNGMAINYDPNEFSIETTFGGKITENIVQALARIVLSEHMLTINDAYPVAFTVHDEISVVCHSDPDDVLDYMIDVFKKAPHWCSDLPLDAEGSYAHYYSK